MRAKADPPGFVHIERSFDGGERPLPARCGLPDHRDGENLSVSGHPYTPLCAARSGLHVAPEGDLARVIDAGPTRVARRPTPRSRRRITTRGEKRSPVL